MEYDDDSYSLDEFADDFASHYEQQLALSSICEEVESRKSSKQRDDDSYSVDEDFASASKHEATASYSVDEDFASTSNHHDATAWKVAPSSPESRHHCESKEDFDVEEKDPAPLPILDVYKVHEHQENTEECKQDLETSHEDVNAVYCIDGVSSEPPLPFYQAEEMKDDDDEDGDGDGVVDVAANLKATHEISIGQMPAESEDEVEVQCREVPKSLLQDAQTQTQPKGAPTQPKQKPPVKKPVSFVPRCAFAQTKSMKLRMGDGKHGGEQEKPKARRYSMKRLEQLAQPVKHHLHNKENIRPEQSSKSCTQKKKKSIDYDSDYGESFLDRMENMERERQEKLAQAKAEAAYNARADKKLCPNCGMAQPYQEMIEGTTQCKNDTCRTEKHLYQPPKQFVLKQFEKRMDRSAKRRSLVLNRIEEERRSSIVHTSQRRSRRQKELNDKIAKEDFNTRMAKDIHRRKEKIQNLEATARKLLLAEHSFKPKLKVADHLVKHRKGGWDALAAPSRRYTEEYQPPDSDWGRKKKKRRRRRKPLESPWNQSGHTKEKVDEDRMKQRFQRLIM